MLYNERSSTTDDFCGAASFVGWKLLAGFGNAFEFCTGSCWVLLRRQQTQERWVFFLSLAACFFLAFSIFVST